MSECNEDRGGRFTIHVCGIYPLCFRFAHASPPRGGDNFPLKPSRGPREHHWRFAAIFSDCANPEEIVVDDEVLKCPFIDLPNKTRMRPFRRCRQPPMHTVPCEIIRIPKASTLAGKGGAPAMPARVTALSAVSLAA